jgi:hypothetical protein
MLSKKLLLLLLLFLTISVSKAQLSFPKGSTLDLNTNINFLYFETEILFHTGKILVSEYDWEKVSDSIDTRWLIGSCFNGDCWNDLPQKGSFVKDYGFNDTTGFIRFHVETYDTNGKSVIQYKVVNRNNLADQALLTFNITFKKFVGIADNDKINKAITIYQDGNNANIQFNLPESIIVGRIMDMQGKTTRQYTSPKSQIEVEDLTNGLYIIEIKTAKNTYIKKFII